MGMAGRGTWVRRTGTCALAVLAMAAAGAAPAGAASKADVLFLFDTTGSMGGALEGAKEQMLSVQDRIRAEIPDVQFAVAEHKDYPFEPYGDPEDFPWKLRQPVTADKDKILAAIEPMTADGGNDSPESYAGALHQADVDPAVGWRSGSRRLIVLIADDMPHDHDLNEGIPEELHYNGSPWDEGADPGPDGQLDTADDVDWQPLLRELADHGIPLMYVHFNGVDEYLPYWRIWAGITGGRAEMAGSETLGDTIVELVELGIEGELTPCPAGEVRDADNVCGPPKPDPEPEPKTCLPGEQVGTDGACHVQPVIFIPGIMGSEIWCGDYQLWMKYRLGTGISHKEMLLASDGYSPRDPGDACNNAAGPVDGKVVRSFAGTDVYGEDVDNLRRFFGDKLYVFSYDWRKSPGIAADRLDAFMTRVQAANAGVKVRIMAHSMGGLVTQSFINLPARAARVAAAVTIGTPYWGSPKSLLPVARGDTGPGMINPLDAILDNDEIKDLSSNMTGLYHLFPSNLFHVHHGGWLTISERSKTPIATADATALAMDRQWSQTNLGLYRQAISTHATTLDGFRTNGVRYLAIVGAGKETMTDIEFDDDLFRDDWKWGYGDGDGTVPLLSAAQGRTTSPPFGDAVPRWYRCDVKHDELSGDVPVQADAINWLMGWSDVPRSLSPSPCGASGQELGLRSSGVVSGGASAAAARRAMKVTVVAKGRRYSLDAAVKAGLVELIQRDADEIVLVTDSSAPVTVSVAGRKVSATLRSLSGDKEGAARTFGPASGTLTVKGAKVMRGRKALRVNRDRRGPRTTVKVARTGRGAVLRVRARDRSGVAATMLSVGGRKAKLVRRGRVRIARIPAKGVRVRYQSLDVLGNREKVHTLRLRR
jgi:hypothetical protein